jgi:hypothetical protein
MEQEGCREKAEQHAIVRERRDTFRLYLFPVSPGGAGSASTSVVDLIAIDCKQRDEGGNREDDGYGEDESIAEYIADERDQDCGETLPAELNAWFLPNWRSN